MKKNFRIFLFASALTVLATSCFDDKGNYTYSDVETIEVTLPENIAAMSSAEYINFNPTVVSSIKGEIKDGDPNYEFSCKLQYTHQDEEYKTQHWVDMDPEKTKEINFFPTQPSGTYTIWYAVKNVETGVEYGFSGKVSLISPVYEGWMVLTNTGSDKRVRLDMISKNSAGEELVAVDVTNDGKSVTLHNGRQLLFCATPYSQALNKDQLYLLSGDGAYQLVNSTLAINEANELGNLGEYMGDMKNPVFMEVTYYTMRMMIDENNDAHALHSMSAGAGFEELINTNVQGNPATFKVAPAIGVSMYRPFAAYTAMLYDTTNKRFIYSMYAFRKTYTFAEDDALPFKYETGKDFVAMKNTKFSNNCTYTVLQDPSTKERSVYGITYSGYYPKAASYYDGITAEHFNDADLYEFHSQYPFMYYTYGNKIYEYGLTNKQLIEQVEVPAGEKIQLIKFNLFHTANQSYLKGYPDVLNKQYDLIVASTTGQENGGILRFYSISETGKMELKQEFKGLGEDIVDVCYRERRTTGE